MGEGESLAGGGTEGLPWSMAVRLSCCSHSSFIAWHLWSPFLPSPPAVRYRLSRSQEDSAAHPSLPILEEHRAAHAILTVGLEIFGSDEGRAGNSESPLVARISSVICRSPARLCPPSPLAPPLCSSLLFLRGCPSESFRTRALGGQAPFCSRPGLCLEEARQTGEGSRRFAGILSLCVPNVRCLQSPEL